MPRDCDHAAIKLDPARWESETERLPGHATDPVMGDGDFWIVLRNCKECRSTLGKEIDVELRP